jgi:hypothetical protein
MSYGTPPVEIGRMEVICEEMLFFHDLPIKLAGQNQPLMEQRLKPFEGIVGRACCDYIGIRGLDAYIASYVYLCAKRLYQAPGCPFNRPGWHTDGFGTDDINYAWSDHTPTVFNLTPMELSDDDEVSMAQMDAWAKAENDRTYADGMLLRLDQFVVHRVGDIRDPGMRTFCKVTFSKDRFNLAGNSRNHLLDYDWPMRKRRLSRNVPGSSLQGAEKHGG